MPPRDEIASQVTHESQNFLTALETEMDRFLAEQHQIMGEISAETLPLLEAIKQLSQGGKRLRALLAYWGFRGCAGSPNKTEIVKVGVALELFQTAALIHDDIIDASNTRRGAPSVHRRFEAMHRKLNYKTSAENFGISSAILTGDLCLSWSEMVFSSIGRATAEGETRRIFDLMRTEVMAGQYLDIVGEVVQTEDPETALQRALHVIRFKSAKYSCEHPIMLGGALAQSLTTGADSTLLAGYSSFALPLGEGFQLRDDVLGVFGDPETTGKPAGDDLREGKRTVLTAYTAMYSNDRDRAFLENSLGDTELSAQKIRQLQELITSSGALDSVEELIDLKNKQARTALAALPVDRLVHAGLQEIATRALKRAA